MNFGDELIQEKRTYPLFYNHDKIQYSDFIPAMSTPEICSRIKYFF